MRTSYLLSFLFLAAGLLGLAGASSPIISADPDVNRKLLQEIAAIDPEHFARLKDNFERFRTMSPQRQEQLRQLDRQLHEEDSRTQVRLMRTLDEYAAWLTRLPDADRQRIQLANGSAERLKVVREIRDQQWLASLPKAQRDEYGAALDNRKPELLAKWRAEERTRAKEWADARQRGSELASERPLGIVNQDEFRRFVERLRPMLGPLERERLRRAEEEWQNGNMFFLARVVLELSDKHPQLSLPSHPQYAKFESLPEEYKKAIQKLPSKDAQHLRNSLLPERWPSYAIEVTETLRRHDLAPKKQLGPATAAEFSPAIQKFIDSLPANDKQRLKAVEGRWPEYPKLLHELAREHKTALPDLTLPGDARRWELIRMRRGTALGPLPEPPAQMLERFAMQIAKDDPAGPRLSLMDPQDREVIKAKFFEKYPELLDKLRALDRQKMERKGKSKGAE